MLLCTQQYKCLFQALLFSNPGVEPPKHMVIRRLIFRAPAILFSMAAAPFPPATHKGCSFSTCSPELAMFCFSDIGHPGGREGIVRGFHVHSPNQWWYSASFHVLLGHSCIFEKYLFQSFAHFKFCCCWVAGALYIFWILTTYQTYTFPINFLLVPVGECDQKNVTTSLTWEWVPGTGGSSAPPVLGMWAPLALPTPRNCSKDTAWRQRCDVEDTCMLYLTEPS